MVVHATSCDIEHLHPELDVASVLEVQETADLQVMGAGEPLLAGVEGRLTLPVEQDLDRPQAKVATGFPQVNPGWLPAIEKLCELLREPLSTERVLSDEDGELEDLVLEAVRLLSRRQ
jgi:hypothetical protein